MTESLHIPATVLGVALMTAATKAPNVDILLDELLIHMMIAGAVAGGFLTLMFCSEPREDKVPTKRQASRWVASSVFSLVFTPVIVEQTMTTNPANVLATSALLGMFAWLFVDLIHKAIVRRFNRFMNDR